MALPCKIDGFPVLHLTQIEERLLQLLVDGKVHTTMQVTKAIWGHNPPIAVYSSLHNAARSVRSKVAPHGYMLVVERGVGYALIKDTRKFD